MIREQFVSVQAYDGKSEGLGWDTLDHVGPKTVIILKDDYYWEGEEPK